MREKAIIAVLCFAGFCAFDVPPFDLGIQILEEADAFVVLAVSRELDEVEGVVGGDGL